jgi:hypothetical protein
VTGARTDVARAAPVGRPRDAARCLDYRCKRHTARAGRSTAKVYNRARVYRTGEIEVRTVMVNPASRPPERRYGPRESSGVSGRGRRAIRRGVGALVRSRRCSPALYTLTSQAAITDEVFAHAMDRWLKWCRKWVPGAAERYVWVRDLQQRGVLHAHVLFFDWVPPELWDRMRRQWVEVYGMGPGSFDVARVRRPSRAAAYIARYITRHHDGEGVRIGRNGKPYVRTRFRGNAYGMSQAIRALTFAITELALPWTTGPRLGAVNLRGAVWFFDGPDEAHAALERALTPGCSVWHRAKAPPPGAAAIPA